MPMYNVIEYSDIYSKTSLSLWQYYRNERYLDNNNNVIDFPAKNKNSISFQFEEKITWETGNNGTKDVERIAPLKYLSNFWRTLEMSLINCEITFMLTWSKNCFLVAETVANQEPIFMITDTKLYDPVATLPSQNNQWKKLFWSTSKK